MSLSSNLIKNPGLRVLPPGVERYVIQGGGIHVFEINSDDKIEIVNDEGKQFCEVIAFNSKGKHDLTILNLKANSDGDFLKKSISQDQKISNILKKKNIKFNEHMIIQERVYDCKYGSKRVRHIRINTYYNKKSYVFKVISLNHNNHLFQI